MTDVVRASHVTMAFKSKDVIKDVSITVGPGEQVALLGHNGAGKTTLFRILLGFIKPTRGQVWIAGHGAGSKSARQIVSYLPEQVAFPKVLTGREVLQFYSSLKRSPRCDVQAVLKKVALVEAADNRVETYSKGMRQRLGLAQALLGEPGLLLLDEPTSGLDPNSRQQFYELIADVASRGGAVLLSSHSLSELEAKTDRVAILRKGELVADGPLSTLHSRANLPIRIRVRAAETAVDQVHTRIGGKRVNSASVELQCQLGEKMSTLAKISALGGKVEDIDVVVPTLDEIYRHYSKLDPDSSVVGTTQ